MLQHGSAAKPQFGAPCSGGATPVVQQRRTRGVLVLDAI
jgi:hypothetical protein